MDLVTITQAEWNFRTQTLTVGAKSSDGLKKPVLSVVNPAFGQIVGGVGNFACPIAPATLTVTSASGGEATKTVQILP